MADSPLSLLESILSSADYGIMAFDALRDESGKIIDFVWQFANTRGAQLAGFSADELVGTRLLERMPGNRDAGLFEAYCQVVETRQPRKIEQYYPGEGIEKWFTISAVPHRQGFLVSFQDITNLKQAVLSAESQRKRYQMLFEESNDATFLTNDQFVLLDVNRAFIQLFGLSKEALRGKYFGDFFQKADWQALLDLLAQQGRCEDTELVIEDAKGDQKTLRLTCEATLNEDQSAILHLGVVKDVTRSQQIERQALLAEKLLMTGKLTRSLAHEVRNPLNNLSLALEQLKDEVGPEVEDAELYFSIMARNAKRIASLIDNLLDSSKPRDLNLTPHTLDEAIAETESLIADRLQLQRIRLVKKLAQPAPALPLDIQQLTLALANLCINAIEAMPEGTGVLTLSTRYKKELALLRVTDNGKGIPSQYLDQLFDPFFSRKQGGNGLGLTAVQNIVHGHRGTIEVSSTPGEGTTFTLTFLR